MAWLREVIRGEHGFSTTVVAVASDIATRCGVDGTTWPSRQTIADDLDISCKTVTRATRQLANAGLLLITQRNGKSGFKVSSNYRLILKNDPDLGDMGVPKEGSPKGHGCPVLRDTGVPTLEVDQLEGEKKTPKPPKRAPSKRTSRASGETLADRMQSAAITESEQL